MIAAEQSVWEGVLGGLKAGQSGWLVTVLSTWGASPRLPGSVYVQWDDGCRLGSVSGGCIEDDLFEVLAAQASSEYQVKGLTYGDRPGDRERFLLPCGGSMHLLVERYVPDPVLIRHVADMAEGIRRREPRMREVCMQGGKWPQIRPVRCPSASTIAFEGEWAQIHYGPPLRVLMIGAGPVAEALARLSLEAGLDVALCEPRAQYRQSWKVDGIDAEAALPDDWLLAQAPDERTAVVCLSHDPRVDDMALLAALKRPALLVGAMASERTAGKRRSRLAQLGLSPFEISRLESPLGLPVGSRLPFEIALSILGRILQLKNARQSGQASMPFPQGLKQARM